MSLHCLRHGVRGGGSGRAPARLHARFSYAARLCRSFIAGFRNNLLGMFGFVNEGRKSKNAFKERMSIEEEILAKAAAKKAARLAAQNKGR